MITVELKRVRLFAYHGLFPEELKTGNEFEINLAVSYQPVTEVIDSIDDTINYASLFQLVNEQFQTPVALLETLAIQITREIKRVYPIAKRIIISIDKLQPPISKFTGQVSVRFEQEY